jgi:PST family polysaccharide transporter
MAVILVFSEFINTLIFGSRNFVSVIRLLAFVLPLHVINLYLISILQGFNAFSKVIKINIASHFLNIIAFALLVYWLNLEGALFTIVIVPSAMLIFTLYYVQSWFGAITSFRWSRFSTPVLKNLGQYAFMTLISSLSFPLVFLGIRNLLIDSLGESSAGFWESTVRISSYYLLFILSLLNLFILPKMAEAQKSSEFRAIVFNFYKQILPFFVVGLILVYILRDWIVTLIFSKDFLPAADLFFWQIIGDFFRVLAMVMVYQFHAKKMLWHYIITDLFLALSLFLSAIYLVPKIGLEGVVLGHALTYILYFLIILFIFRKSLIFYKR